MEYVIFFLKTCFSCHFRFDNVSYFFVTGVIIRASISHVFGRFLMRKKLSYVLMFLGTYRFFFHIYIHSNNLPISVDLSSVQLDVYDLLQFSGKLQNMSSLSVGNFISANLN